MSYSRRDFVRASAIPAVGVYLSSGGSGAGASAAATNMAETVGQTVTGSPAANLQVGLSHSSLLRSIAAGDLDPSDYPAFVKDTFGIERVDWFTSVRSPSDRQDRLLRQVSTGASRVGTDLFMLMGGTLRLVSDRGDERFAEVSRFHRVVDQTELVGARYTRLSLDTGRGSWDGQAVRAIDGLRRLSDYAESRGVTVVVEPGTGAARNGVWLANVIDTVGHPACRSLPGWGKASKSDRYAGTAAMMSSASVISAQSHAVDAEGLELRCDYRRQFELLVEGGFCGIIAIQYEGDKPTEVTGIRATQKLLQQLHDSLAGRDVKLDSARECRKTARFAMR